MGVWKQACERFVPPRTGRGKGTKAQRASDRKAWRTLRAIEAHLHAIWCLCDTDESVEGFENAMAYLVERRGQPGARCAKGRQFFTKRQSLFTCCWPVRRSAIVPRSVGYEP